MTHPTIVLSPRKPFVSAQGGVLEVLVRVQAPDQPEERKTTVISKRLALVVDSSGSMSGEPLTEALRCVNRNSGNPVFYRPNRCRDPRLFAQKTGRRQGSQAHNMI